MFFLVFLTFTFTVHTIYSTEKKKRRQYVRHDKKKQKNRTITKIWYIYGRCFYVVIILLVNTNWKKRSNEIKEVILYSIIIYKFKIYIFSSSDHPANERHKPNADSMPVHRLRRRPGTKSTLGQCVVSILSNSLHRNHNKTRYMSTQRRYNADPAPQTVGQDCTNTRRMLRAWRDDHKPHTYKRYLHIGGTVTMLWTKAGLILARRLWLWPTLSVAWNTTR